MTTPIISNITAATGAGATAATTPQLPQQTLGQQDFLNLLVKELSTQDPMQPMSNTDFVAQMAQFTTLQQTQAMQQGISQLGVGQRFTQASTLLGHTVTLQTGKGAAPLQGTVTAVLLEGGTPEIVVNGAKYDVSQLYSLSVTNTQPTTGPKPARLGAKTA